MPILGRPAVGAESLTQVVLSLLFASHPSSMGSSGAEKAASLEVEGSKGGLRVGAAEEGHR